MSTFLIKPYFIILDNLFLIYSILYLVIVLGEIIYIYYLFCWKWLVNFVEMISQFCWND